MGEKIAYKDYPLNILFKKLHKSNDPEKRKIRNAIVLKQVFGLNAQEKLKTEVMQYKKSYGIIKDINGDNLRLWIPKTDSHIEYYVGIDRIPVENSNKYNITKSNISKYASIVYTTDNRIYKIEISFHLAAPTDLYVKRENNENIVGWGEPPTAKKASRYQVFINEKPFATVEDAAVKVPRAKKKADKYYVKAIYKHEDSFVNSDTSDVLYDVITAKELGLKDFKAKKYTSAMNRFSRAFSKQVINLKSKDKLIKGLLALPSACRAEIYFLIELDRLKEKNVNNDNEFMINSLEELSESIENAEGVWVIIPEAKRSKIKYHISKLQDNY